MFRVSSLLAAACFGLAAYLATRERYVYVPRYVGRLPDPRPEPPPLAPAVQAAHNPFFDNAGAVREFSAN